MVSSQDPPITDLPPSSKLIYYVLKKTGSMTNRQIVVESRLSDQTALNGLKRFENSNAITKRKRDTAESSQKEYCLV